MLMRVLKVKSSNNQSGLILYYQVITVCAQILQDFPQIANPASTTSPRWAFSVKWRKLGRCFGLSTNELDNYATFSMLDNSTCCERVFDYWVTNGGYPLSIL